MYPLGYTLLGQAYKNNRFNFGTIFLYILEYYVKIKLKLNILGNVKSFMKK